VGSLQCSPDLLAELKVRREEEYEREWVKQGWGNNGRRGRDGGGKRKEVGIHPTRGPRLLFSRGCPYDNKHPGSDVRTRTPTNNATAFVALANLRYINALNNNNNNNNNCKTICNSYTANVPE